MIDSINSGNTRNALTLSVNDAAKMVGVSSQSVRKYAKDGRLDSRRWGRRLLIPVGALLEFLEIDPPQTDDDQTGAGGVQ